MPLESTFSNRMQTAGLLVSTLFALFLPVELQAKEEAAEVTLGERLFQETRFSQAFYKNPGKADPVMDYSTTESAKLPGPFRGHTINCRGCHMVDEHKKAIGGGVRSYADFARRSPIPVRNAKLEKAPVTLRNSQMMVSILAKPDALLHFDGEFNSIEDLILATLTGRNFGWLPREYPTAIKHIAQVIRRDKGDGDLAREFGGAYAKVLAGTDKSLPAKFRLPAGYRIDVTKASDKQVVDVVVRLIAAYIRSLNFSTDKNGIYNGSAYDRFLQVNGLPQKPAAGESDQAYSRRLAVALTKLKSPKFVARQQGKLKYHKQDFVFGKQELTGMKLFFAKGKASGSGGNCVSCHTAPHFSDFAFHNTGMTQHNYDRLHGPGAFNKLALPGLQQRNKNYNRYLPASVKHPDARSTFKSALNKAKPQQVDLGLWNIFANPDMPRPQNKIRKLLCQQARQQNQRDCSDSALLPLSIAAFKTPILRDLGQSGPYMHTGQFSTIELVLQFYLQTSAQARSGQLRNIAPDVKHIRLQAKDLAALAAFLKALNEDYD